MKWIAKHPDYGLTFPLAVVCALLTVGFAVELAVLQRPGSEKGHTGAPAPPPLPGTGEEADVSFVLPPVEEFAEFVDRPLFVEGRKPPPEEAPKQAAEAQDTTPLNLKLMGVLFSPSGEMAIVAEATGKNRRVKKGGTISGWRLVSLKPDRVTVQRGEEQRDLVLLKPRPKTGPPPGPGQPQPPGPGGPPLRRGAHPPTDVVEPEPEEMEMPPDAGDPGIEEDLSEMGEEMPEGEE